MDFRLRRGVRWYNGDTFSADDVSYTYNRTRNPAVGSLWRNLLDFIDRLARLDPLTVRFVLRQPRASFLVKITERSTGRAMTVANRRAVEQLGREYSRRPVGTGPFRIVNQAHRASFDPIVVKTCDLNTPGTSTVDYLSLPYQRLPRPIFPIDRDLEWQA